MLPTLRSVIAQVHNRGGRSIRNFSASPGRIGDNFVDKIVYVFTRTRYPAYLVTGYAMFGAQEVYQIMKVKKKIDQEHIPRREEIKKRFEELRRGRSTTNEEIAKRFREL